jgi:cyanophycin synthetase
MACSMDGADPGRVNLFKVHKGYVLLDYGHNAEAIGAIARLSAATDCPRVTGIVGVPGDRADAIIEEAGRTAARGFQRLIIREDLDLRGRQKGEVPRMLHDAVRNTVPGRECYIVPDTCGALERALIEMMEEELIVVFYETFEPVLEMISLYGAVPVQSMNVTRRATVKTAI